MLSLYEYVGLLQDEIETQYISNDGLDITEWLLEISDEFGFNLYYYDWLDKDFSKKLYIYGFELPSESNYGLAVIFKETKTQIADKILNYYREELVNFFERNKKYLNYKTIEEYHDAFVNLLYYGGI